MRASRSSGFASSRWRWLPMRCWAATIPASKWGFLAGPDDCSGAPNLSTGDPLLSKLNDVRVVRCDEVQWRFLGLSLAGYNVLISLAMAAIAVCGNLSRPQSGLTLDNLLPPSAPRAILSDRQRMGRSRGEVDFHRRACGRAVDVACIALAADDDADDEAASGPIVSIDLSTTYVSAPGIWIFVRPARLSSALLRRADQQKSHPRCAAEDRIQRPLLHLCPVSSVPPRSSGRGRGRHSRSMPGAPDFQPTSCQQRALPTVTLTGSVSRPFDRAGTLFKTTTWSTGLDLDRALEQRKRSVCLRARA